VQNLPSPPVGEGQGVRGYGSVGNALGPDACGVPHASGPNALPLQYIDKPIGLEYTANSSSYSNY